MKNITTSNISILNAHADNAIAHFVFAHGAGADMHHEFMQTMTELLLQQQISVTRFNFPYMDRRIQENKRFPPNRMPVLVACYQQVLSELKTDLPIFIGGKSMGSRVAATLVTTEFANDLAITEKIKGVICLGYPFHPPKKPESLRLQPLQQALKPILIIQGERDSLGNKSEIPHYLLSKMCQIEFLVDGDHSLKPRKKSGYQYQQHLQLASEKIKQFISNSLNLR